MMGRRQDLTCMCVVRGVWVVGLLALAAVWQTQMQVQMPRSNPGSMTKP
jgi:hypothetical protein